MAFLNWSWTGKVPEMKIVPPTKPGAWSWTGKPCEEASSDFSVAPVEAEPIPSKEEIMEAILADARESRARMPIPPTPSKGVIWKLLVELEQRVERLELNRHS